MKREILMATDPAPARLTDIQIREMLGANVPQRHMVFMALRDLLACREEMRSLISYCEAEASNCDPYCCKIYLDEVAERVRAALGDTPERRGLEESILLAVRKRCAMVHLPLGLTKIRTSEGGFDAGMIAILLVEELAAWELGPEVCVSYPRDWWQAVRGRFLPKWWLRRRPVKQTTRTFVASKLLPAIPIPATLKRGAFDLMIPK